MSSRGHRADGAPGHCPDQLPHDGPAGAKRDSSIARMMKVESFIERPSGNTTTGITFGWMCLNLSVQKTPEKPPDRPMLRQRNGARFHCM